MTSVAWASIEEGDQETEQDAPFLTHSVTIIDNRTDKKISWPKKSIKILREV